LPTTTSTYLRPDAVVTVFPAAKAGTASSAAIKTDAAFVESLHSSEPPNVFTAGG
jgi:hypothetical protein